MVTNKFAYLGQYFDKAYKWIPIRALPRLTETGVLSRIRRVLSDGAGRAILSTKPDPEQGNSQGTMRDKQHQVGIGR